MDLSSIPTKQIQDQIEEFKIKFQNDLLLGELSQRCKIAIEKLCDAPDEYQKLDCNKLIDALKAKDHKLYMTILKSDCSPLLEKFNHFYTITTEKRHSVAHANDISENLGSIDLRTRLTCHPLWDDGGRLMCDLYLNYILPAVVQKNILGPEYLMFPLKKFPERLFHGTI